MAKSAVDEFLNSGKKSSPTPRASTPRPRSAPRGGGSAVDEFLSSSTTTATSHTKKPKKGTKKSAGGLLGNLLSGAEHAVTGLGPGLIGVGKAAVHDLPAMLELKPFYDKNWVEKDSELNKTGEAISASYKKKYGPLAHGDARGTWNEVYKDPFGTILDAAMLASGGVGGATKAGLLEKAADEITLTAPSGATVTKAIGGGSQLAKRLKLAADATLKKLPPDMRVLGEDTRYAKVVSYKNLRRQTGLTLNAGPYHVAMSKLSHPEMVASNLLHEFPTRQLLEDEKARLLREVPESPNLRLMNDPKILKLVDSPTAKMHTVLEESQKLTSKQEDLLTSGVVKKGGKKGTVPALTEESALLRRYQPSLIARGAKVDKTTGELVAPAGTSIPDMAAQIRSEVEAEGRHQPIYRPQQMGEDHRGMAVGTGGKGVQRNVVHQNKAILQTLGKVAYDTEALTPSYMRTVKWAIYTDRHADLMNAAVKVERGQTIGKPGEYVYIKRNLAEKIPHTEQAGAEFEARMEQTFPTEAHQGAEDLVTAKGADPAILEDAKGYRYMVPKTMADKIVGEYVRSSTAASKILSKPTTVWRSLVLNMRVGWLTNNIVGNTLMYGIRNAGLRGLKTYLQALDDITVSKLLRSKETLSHLTPEDIAEIIPEQAAGTFYGTQMPRSGTSVAARAMRKAAKYSTQPLRKLDIATEQALRRAMVNKLVRESPEFKTVWAKMPEETRTFRQASRETLGEPKVVERVSKSVNDALGDFMQMSSFEQNTLRSLMPFYAWYREITRITLKLPLELPARTNLLMKIGQIGWDDSVKKLGPDGIEQYLRALFLIGNPKRGEIGGINTSGLNPYQTVVQEGQAISSLVNPNANNRQQLTGLLNPFIGGSINYFGGGGTYPGAKAQGPGAIRSVLGSIIAGLPQFRLAAQEGLVPKSIENYAGYHTPGPQATYKPSELDALLGFFGTPHKTVEINNAKASYYKNHPRG